LTNKPTNLLMKHLVVLTATPGKITERAEL